jgi:hypothetical protein
VNRREFITLLGGTAAARPLAARAQQPAMPVIGYLHPAFPAPNAHLAVVMRQVLADAGFVEGRNLTIEYRFAEGKYDRLYSRGVSPWRSGRRGSGERQPPNRNRLRDAGSQPR